MARPPSISDHSSVPSISDDSVVHHLTPSHHALPLNRDTLSEFASQLRGSSSASGSSYEHSSYLDSYFDDPAIPFYSDGHSFSSETGSDFDRASIPSHEGYTPPGSEYSYSSHDTGDNRGYPEGAMNHHLRGEEYLRSMRERGIATLKAESNASRVIARGNPNLTPTIQNLTPGPPTDESSDSDVPTPPPSEPDTIPNGQSHTASAGSLPQSSPTGTEMGPDTPASPETSTTGSTATGLSDTPPRYSTLTPRLQDLDKDIMNSGPHGPNAFGSKSSLGSTPNIGPRQRGLLSSGSRMGSRLSGLATPRGSAGLPMASGGSLTSMGMGALYLQDQMNQMSNSLQRSQNQMRNTEAYNKVATGPGMHSQLHANQLQNAANQTEETRSSFQNAFGLLDNAIPLMPLLKMIPGMPSISDLFAPKAEKPDLNTAYSSQGKINPDADSVVKSGTSYGYQDPHEEQAFGDSFA
ncbi:VP4 [Cat Tien Hospitalitermes polycipi-like virus]|nr:VP4 [Cat Tien Hospitalitermes polycipi-like virus]